MDIYIRDSYRDTDIFVFSSHLLYIIKHGFLHGVWGPGSSIAWLHFLILFSLRYSSSKRSGIIRIRAWDENENEKQHRLTIAFSCSHAISYTTDDVRGINVRLNKHLLITKWTTHPGLTSAPTASVAIAPVWNLRWMKSRLLKECSLKLLCDSVP